MQLFKTNKENIFGDQHVCNNCVTGLKPGICPINTGKGIGQEKDLLSLLRRCLEGESPRQFSAERRYSLRKNPT